MSFFFLKILLLICCLISVAFITLLERKILGYIQTRKGPNKIFFMGLFQPFTDALKLFSKETMKLSWSNQYLFFMAPFISFILMLSFWLSINFLFSFNTNISNDFVFIILVSSLGVYPILFAGWASNSKYATLGCYRNIAQTISYEVSFSFVILSILLFSNSLNIFKLNAIQNKSLPFFMGFFILFILWLVIILAETNRSPFDFAESESELVSGFNIEFGGTEFAILFMAEYGNIIFFSILTCYMFFNPYFNMFLMFKFMILMVFFLWVRGTFVRFRYDNLMMLTWKIILPFSIFMFLTIFMTIFIF
uniref:NADH-ubiquinone oxidoreductase chain 1 n=1 Tax=Hypoaspis linteyini TaxID=2695865 RepID=A0A6B9WGJ8_9ACAR|nr:NADH dehydrogenase subunit 1 [Hypoaspis linteyini]QHQ98586.1 NADH dehydrogenase subunit 1 [Hypoaspis linteyini]